MLPFVLRLKEGASYLRDSSTATATETVMPTMGLLPAPRKPIISTSKSTFGGFRIGGQHLFERKARLFAKQEARPQEPNDVFFLDGGILSHLLFTKQDVLT